MRCGIIIEKNQLWIKLFDDSPFKEDENGKEEGKVIILNKKNVPRLIKQLKESLDESKEQ